MILILLRSYCAQFFFSPRLDGLLQRLPGSFLALIAFGAPLVFFPGLTNWCNLPQFSFLALAMGLLLCLWAVRILSELRPATIYWAPSFLPLYALFAWLTASLFLIASNRHEGILIWQQWVVAMAALFLASQLISRPEDQKKIQGSLFAAGIIVSLIGICQHLFAFSLIPQIVPPAATFANKNNAIHFVVLIFPLGAGILLLARRSAVAWLASLGLGVILTYLTYTRTRAGWVAVAAEIVLIGIYIFHTWRRGGGGFSWNRTKTAALLVSLCLVANLIQFGPNGYSPGFGEILGQASSIGSPERNHSRLAIWTDSLELIKDRFPWGVGPGNFKIFFPRYQKESAFLHTQVLKDTHNDYLQLAAEAGLPGVVLLLLFCWLFFGMVKRLLRRPETAEYRCEIVSLVAAVAGFGINAAFDFPMQMMIPLFTVMLLLGCLGSYFPREWKLPKGAKIVFLGALLTVVVAWPLLLDRVLRNMLSSHFLMNAIVYEHLEQWEPARKNAVQALRLNPADATIHAILGRADRSGGDFEAALTHFQQVRQAYPYSYHALVDLGETCYRQGDYGKALFHFNRIHEMFPKDGGIWNVIGLVYFKQGKIGEARQQFLRAVELDPENREIYLRNLEVLEGRKPAASSRPLEAS